MLVSDMRRRSLLAGGAATLVAALAPAVTRAAGQPELRDLRYQGWASRVVFPELAEDLGYLEPLKLKWVGNTFSGPQDIQATVTGDTDFGGAFIGAIEKLTAAGAPIKAVIGNSGCDKESWPGLYVLEENPIKGPRDLLGKKIAVNTLGAHDEFMIDQYLQRGGLDPAEIGQVTLVAMPQGNAEQSLRLKQVDAAVLADLFREKAVAAGGLRLLLADYTLFGRFTSGAYVVTDSLLQSSPNTVHRFVEGTARAIDWVQTHSRADVIARFQDIIRKRSRQDDLTAVTYWKSAGLGGRGGLLSDRNFSIFIDWFRDHGDAAIGALHPRALYTNEFNPYRDEQSG
jgi:ABC-type nitrate/sulfonate/bicarbonate transport system substrate-binding protein